MSFEVSFYRTCSYVSFFRYWSWEAIAEWLISINKYLHHLQTASVKKTRYMNLIMDETRDIITKQMICLCLRYVEEDTGKICEQLFMLKPITDTTGEGKEVRQSK